VFYERRIRFAFGLCPGTGELNWSRPVKVAAAAAAAACNSVPVGRGAAVEWRFASAGDGGSARLGRLAGSARLGSARLGWLVPGV